MGSSLFSERYLSHTWTTLDAAYLWVMMGLLVPVIFIDVQVLQRWRPKESITNASAD